MKLLNELISVRRTDEQEHDDVDNAKGKKPKFDVTWCSQCGEEFGPGDSGYSHCKNHKTVDAKGDDNPDYENCEEEEDWQEDYATDTGSSAVCPKCQSTDIDHGSMQAIKQRLMAYYRVCQDCGHKSDWTGPDAGLAQKRFGHPNASEEEENSESQTPSDRGYAAAEKGQGRDANPYPRGTEEHDEWIEAWNDSNQYQQGDSEPENDLDRFDRNSDRREQFSDFMRASRGDEEEEEKHRKCDYADHPHSGGGTNHGPATHSRGGYNICDKCYEAMMAAYKKEKDHYKTGSEDEGESERGLGKYGQQGAGMGGEKQTNTDEFELNPDAADELDLDDELGDNDDESDEKLNAVADQSAEDPDHQGLIRKVKDAHLVYKRQTEEGTYEELWIYNAGNMRDELEVRKAILAGTDVPTTQRSSPDGAQEVEIWSSGNAELLQIVGLPN